MDTNYKCKIMKIIWECLKNIKKPPIKMVIYLGMMGADDIGMNTTPQHLGFGSLLFTREDARVDPWARRRARASLEGKQQQLRGRRILNTKEHDDELYS